MAKLTKRQIRLNQICQCLCATVAPSGLVSFVYKDQAGESGDTICFSVDKIHDPEQEGCLQVWFKDQGLDYVSANICSFVMTERFKGYMMNLMIDPLLDVTTITL